MIRAIPARPLFACVSVLTLVGIVLIYYHDRTWYPPDDGAYANVAERILQGEVLNREVQDVHPGYVNFANALALWLFGETMVSLRYPLVVLGVVQGCLVFFLLRPRGVGAAAAGATALTALSFVQYFNPTANWYCLFLFVATIAGLTWIPRERRWRLVVVGLLVGTIFLFRQLTGVIAGIGVVTYLLTEAPHSAAAKNLWLGRCLISVMGAGLTYYLATKSDPLAAVMYGGGPLGILAWAWIKAATPTREVLRILSRLAAGGAAAVAPLLAYHAANGSLLSWLDDTTFRAVALTEYGFFQIPRYWQLVVVGLGQVLFPKSTAEAINGLFWLVVPLLAPALGFLTLRRLMRPGPARLAAFPLPMLACFYSVVSLHYQIPIYLFYSAGLTMVGLLWLVAASGRLPQAVMVCLACGLTVVGLYFHAGQAHSRGYKGLLKGERVALAPAPGVDRFGLWVEPAELAQYAHFIDLVAREVPPEESILALPSNAELYFLTKRRNPFRFFNSALGIHTQDELKQAVDTLARDPPRLVFHRPDDKYNTAFSWAIMGFVKRHYDLLETTGGFEVYRRRRPGPIEEISQ